MSELEVRHELLDIATGEMLPATVDNAARVLEAIREAERRIRLVRAEVTSFLLEQSQRDGIKTFHSGAGKVELSGGPVKEYDPQALQVKLTVAGCPQSRIDEAIVPEVTYKVNRSVLRQLAGANERYAIAIEQSEYMKEKAYSVRVTP